MSSLDTLHTCPRCHLGRKTWCFPELVAQFFGPDGLTAESRDAVYAVCLYCEGAEKALINTILAVQDAPVEVFDREKLSHQKALQDLLYHVRLVCAIEWDSVPIPVRGHLIRIICHWRNKVALKDILEFMPLGMPYMSKSWKVGFLQRVAEFALSAYTEGVLRKVGSDGLESHQVDVAQFADRIGKMYDPTPADIVSILRELDELFERV
ncbi:hypothetical protein F5Y13DRAFT_185463 [Hypoxylon sp. FL1857]|nr:hypothetical protein F5Y13DRAFT_185463 [Hypoxylon sp. FL1857]